jgi:hypothetical protein
MWKNNFPVSPKKLPPSGKIGIIKIFFTKKAFTYYQKTAVTAEL